MYIKGRGSGYRELPLRPYQRQAQALQVQRALGTDRRPVPAPAAKGVPWVAPGRRLGKGRGTVGIWTRVVNDFNAALRCV